MEGTIVISTEEIVPTKETKGVSGTGPGVYQEEQKVFKVSCSHTVVHPGTVMIHSGYTSITNTAMM